MGRLNVGEKAPALRLPAVPEGEVDLAERAAAAERGVVVYFYPKAGTPGCTGQACDFRDSLASLRAAGYDVIGVSPDSLEALERFADKQDLTFTLASDPDHAVLEAWGAWGEKKNYGRVITGVIRSTVVVDRQGLVTHALYNVRAKGHVARLRRELGLD